MMAQGKTNHGRRDGDVLPHGKPTRWLTEPRKEFHMKSIWIKLAKIDDVYTLVNLLVAYDGDVDLESGRYKVDGKSLLGIFSLNLREPVKLTFHDEDKADELFEKLKDLVVEGPEA